jgi:hypothetical protein
MTVIAISYNFCFDPVVAGHHINVPSVILCVAQYVYVLERLLYQHDEDRIAASTSRHCTEQSTTVVSTAYRMSISALDVIYC